MKSITKDNSAQGGVIGFFIGVLIAVVVALNVAWPVMDSAITGNGNNYASGSFTLSGNVTTGNLVNITNGAAVYRFEFNTTAGSPIACVTANCIPINLTSPDGKKWNDSILASGNLTAAINANSSVFAFLSAANTTSKTTVTAKTIGLAGNDIAIATNAANITASGSTLSGGTIPATGNMSSSARTLVNQLPLFLVLVLLMVFVKAII